MSLQYVEQIEANRLIHIIERFERINFYAKGGQCFFNGNKASVQISIWIILNKCHILTFKHFTVDKNINAINTGASGLPD